MTDTSLAINLDKFMRRMHVLLREKAPSFDTERIGPSGAFLLLTLDDLKSATMQDLADALVRDKSQMTRSVQNLASRGLLERVPCKSDARVVRITLTPRGQEVVRRHQAAIAQTIDDLMAPLPEREQQEFRKLLTRVVGGANTKTGSEKLSPVRHEETT